MVRTTRKKYIKKSKQLFFVCLSVASVIFAGNDEELFLRGNKYYAEKEYDDAFDSYNAISKKGHAVLYNMGNCLFNTHDYSGAFVYWSRAQKRATAYEYGIIMQNKELALKKLGKEKELSFKQKIIAFVQSKLPYVSLLFLQLIFLLCWWLLTVIMCSKKEMKFKKVLQSFLCLYIVVFGALLASYYMQSNTQTAIIVKKDGRLFAGPDKSFHVLSPLMYADSIAVKETREGWYKIQYTDMIGWVEADVIQII